MAEVLGEVSVRVGADLSELRAKLNGEALAEVKKFDAAASKAVQGTGTAFQPVIVGAKQFSQALKETGGDLSKINAGMLGAAQAQRGVAQAQHAAGEAATLSAVKTRQLTTGIEHLAIAAATGEASFAGMTHAAVGYFYEKFSLAGRAETALKEHEATITKIADLWKKAQTSSGEYQAQATTALKYATNRDLSIQKELLQKQLSGQFGLSGLTGQVGNTVNSIESRTAFGSLFLTPQEREQPKFLPAFKEFLASAKEGRPDVERLNAAIQAVANTEPSNVALRKMADSYLAMTKGATGALEAIQEINKINRELYIGQAFEAAGNQPANFGTDLLQRRLTADLQSLRAKSPTEQAAAARAREQATPFQEGESLGQRQFRIEAEATKARAQAEVQLKEAMDQRIDSMGKSIAASQVDLSVIGKTTAEIEAQRMQFNLLAAAQEAAARSHTEVSKQEIEAIKDLSAEYGKLQENIKSTQAITDLVFERENAGRTAIERNVASQLHSLGLSDDSANGRAVAAQARLNEQLKVTVKNLDDVRSASADALNKFIDDLRTGTSLAAALKDAMNNIINLLIKAGVNSIVKGLLGEQGQAGGGLFGNLLGGLLNRGQGGGTTGTVAGGAGGVGSIIGGIFNGRAANDNSNVGKQVWDFFSQKGLAAHQVAGIVGNVSAESGFNPNARGGAGEYGLFQNLGARKTGLFNYAGTTSPSVNDQLSYAWNEMQGPESRALGNLRSSSTVLGATKAMVGFERPSGFSASNPEASMNFTGRVTAAQDALVKYSESTAATAGSFSDQFDSTLTGLAKTTGATAQGFSGSFQSSLQSVVGGIQPGKKGFGGLFSLLGGGGGAGLSAGAMALATSGKSGLFAEGGVSDRPAIFGEAGAEAAVPLSGGRSIPVSLKASPKLMQELRGAGQSRTSHGATMVTIEGTTVVIHGSVDKQTLAQLERRLDERDAKMKKDLENGQIGVINAKHASLKG